MLRNNLLAAGCLAAVATAFASVGASANQVQVSRGDAHPLGQGTAQTWVAVDADREPTAIGVSLSEAALRGLDHQGVALSLPLPPEAKATGFDHVLLNWNPHGHPPAHVWTTPHFDVHFYMVTPAEREAISAADPEFQAKAARHPDARFVPTDYVLESEPIPAMGVHWADATTPELHGKPFTHTLIYGAWDGRFTFIEPMVDKEFLDRRETVVAPVKQAGAIAVPGRYPTQYRIDFDPVAAEHRIVLEGLVARE